MEASTNTSYQPPAVFVEDKKDTLIDLDLTDSTELWLIQWPINEPPDFDGQQVSLNHKGDGHVGTFEGSSGKSYDVVSSKSQGPEVMVFLTSASEAKIAGKISRRVSLVHYPEPSELQRRKSRSHAQLSSIATSTISGRSLLTPARSIRARDSEAGNHFTTPKRTISGAVEPSKRKQNSNKRIRSTDRSDSEKGNSGITDTGSMEHSEERKSKKAKKSTG
ncbi:mediator-associated protein 2-like [Andrographis paniculata]|uniref:mediator-associated protein 2-like n=1 Tax=Andrographis paniculata TaxID=175694 RepID=UPI0021E7ED6D|nr:mediator-associated protein 2-like [Andrographis paniculata]XP_051149716.1 mediator-associated protein 2-like [Andrographis paniculata]